MSYDPMLKGAMSEIEDVLKRYNCGGFVTLASKSHGEFRLIFPEWSTAQWMKNGTAVHFKARKANGWDNVEETVHLLHVVRDTSGMTFMHMEKLIGMLKQHMEITHESLKDFEPHDPSKSY